MDGCKKEENSELGGWVSEDGETGSEKSWSKKDLNMPKIYSMIIH